MNWFRVKIPIRARDPQSFVDKLAVIVFLAVEGLHTGIDSEMTRERRWYLQDVLFQAAQVCFPDPFYTEIPKSIIPGIIVEKFQTRADAQTASRIAAYPEQWRRLYSLVEPLERYGASITPIPAEIITNYTDPIYVQKFQLLFSIVRDRVEDLVGSQMNDVPISTKAVEEALKLLRRSGDCGGDSAEMLQKSASYSFSRLSDPTFSPASLIRHIVAGFLVDRVFRNALGVDDKVVEGLRFIEDSIVNRGKFLVCWTNSL